MRLEDLAPILEAWDRLDIAINMFVVAHPADLARRAASLGVARAEMARHDLPDAVQPFWAALHQTIGATLVSMPHELSASVERLEQRREAMREAIWGLSKTITPAQSQVLGALVQAVDAQKARGAGGKKTHRASTSTRYRR